jgi:hypothetical protein
MNALEKALRAIAGDLDGSDYGWALAGGFAVSARAAPRFTRDVDVAVAVPDDPTAEKLIRLLVTRGYRFVATVEQDDTGRLATARLASSASDRGVLVDLLFATSGIEPEIVAAAEPLDVLPGLTIPVAQVGHLIALKLLARDDQTRPQDLADLRALLGVATSDDLALAGTAIKLITERGFHRDRDLAAGLAELLR